MATTVVIRFSNNMNTDIRNNGSIKKGVEILVNAQRRRKVMFARTHDGRKCSIERPSR